MVRVNMYINDGLCPLSLFECALQTLTVLSDKYEKAVQKILALKQDKILLKQQLEAKQAEISQ